MLFIEILQGQYEELDNKYQKLRSLASSLQTQLAIAQSDADICRIEKDKLYEEKNEQLKMLEDNLVSARQEKDELEKKWQKEFETLRNQNQGDIYLKRICYFILTNLFVNRSRRTSSNRL